jgi:hypothetical protein
MPKTKSNKEKLESDSDSGPEDVRLKTKIMNLNQLIFIFTILAKSTTEKIKVG